MAKGNFKGFILGVVATVLVSSFVIPTMASKMTKTEELYYNDIKVVVAGKRAELKDANGKEVEPFIINGTTYLPVRAVANALEQSVSWDGKTSTVYIGANEEIEQPTVWLKDLDTFTGTAEGVSLDEIEFGGSFYENYLTSNNGNVYKNYYYSSSPEVSYILNGKYSHFKGTLYLTNYGKNHTELYRILVYLDDALVYQSEAVTAGKMPVDFDVEVSNSAVMKIVFQRKLADSDRYSWTASAFGNTYALIGNAGLYK